MRKYILDTNLIVSATLNKRGRPSLGLQKILQSGDRLVFSSETFSEAEDVIKRPKFDSYVKRSKREELLSLCASRGIFVIPEKHFSHCRHEKDNKFLDAAVAGNVAALLTGDDDLLVLKEIEGIPIISLADFLDSGH